VKENERPIVLAKVLIEPDARRSSRFYIADKSIQPQISRS
jgi:hypothetical protein